MTTRSTISWCAVLLAAVGLLVGTRSASAQTQDELFDDAALQEVRLAVSDRDWQTLKAQSELNTYYSADLTWRGTTVRNVGIRSRGSGTRNGVKPGLRVNVNRYVSNQEFLGLKDFILDNTYDDPSGIHESIAMRMLEMVGIPAPREAHARLYVNNEYVGLYVIVESVDRAFISRVFGAAEGNADAGGHLFEYNWAFSYGFESLGPDLAPYAALFQPQTRESDSDANLYQPIEEMIGVINDATDEDFASAVGEYLDLPLFMKYLAVESFLVEWDGFTGNWGANNFYLYRFRDSKRSQLIPWDRDHTFTFMDTAVTFRLDTNVLARRAMAVPELRRAYLDALMQLARLAEEPGADDPRGWLEREAERQSRQVAAAVADDPVKAFTFDDFQTAVAFLSRFARIRPALVDCKVSLLRIDQDETRCSQKALALPRSPQPSYSDAHQLE
jgi:hypothetical protein